MLSPQALAPVVLSCEHATNRLPFRSRRTLQEREVLESHWGWDIGAWELTRELTRRLRTSAIGGRWSRLAIDLNRRVDDSTLVRKVAGGVELSWNVGIGPEEIERRVLEYHTPYHVELDRLVLRRVVRGTRPLLFAVHSFTPVYHGRLRDFEIGMLFERHGDLARRIGQALADSGLRVRYNEPYSGIAGMMYSIDRHGKHHGLPCLELEVNQKMFDEPGAARRLADVTAPAIAALGFGESC